GEKVLHLVDGVGPQHVDGQAALLGVADDLLVAAVVGLERHQRLGVFDVVGDYGRQPQALGRLLQPVAGEAVGVDADGLKRAVVGDGRWQAAGLWLGGGGRRAAHRRRRPGRAYFPRRHDAGAGLGAEAVAAAAIAAPAPVGWLGRGRLDLQLAVG